MIKDVVKELQELKTIVEHANISASELSDLKLFISNRLGSIISELNYEDEKIRTRKR